MRSWGTSLQFDFLKVASFPKAKLFCLQNLIYVNSKVPSTQRLLFPCHLTFLCLNFLINEMELQTTLSNDTSILSKTETAELCCCLTEPDQKGVKRALFLIF